MSNIKILKSLNISSVTIIGTAIHVLLAIIAAVISLIIIGILLPKGLSVIGILIPGVILASFAYTVYNLFTESYLYNWIAKRMNPIAFQFEDDSTITKIDPIPTALIVAIISTIMTIIVIVIGMFIIPYTLNSFVQMLMFTGQSEIALSLYEIILISSNPTYIVIAIVTTFIAGFIYTLIGTYVFNLIGGEIPIELELSQVEEITTVEKLGVKSFAFVFAIIGLILGLISGLAYGVADGNYLLILISAVLGFVSGFVVTAIGAWLYNVLAPRLGKIECELVNE